jgi:hypothetical protein
MYKRVGGHRWSKIAWNYKFTKWRIWKKNKMMERGFLDWHSECLQKKKHSYCLFWNCWCGSSLGTFWFCPSTVCYRWQGWSSLYYYLFTIWTAVNRFLRCRSPSSRTCFYPNASTGFWW